MADSSLETTTALTSLRPERWIRNHVSALAFRVCMALSVFAGGSTISGCRIEDKTGHILSPPEQPDFHALLSGDKLDATCHGVRVENGTTIVSYTYADRSQFKDIGPGGAHSQGERNLRLLTSQEKTVVEDVLRNYIPNRWDIRYELAANPKDAYLHVFAGDLSHFKDGPVYGYAHYPNMDCANLVLSSTLLPSDPTEVSEEQIAFLYDVILHEAGHTLGLKHGHEKADRNQVVLKPEEQTFNVSIMNIEDGKPGVPGGEIASEAAGRAPQTFQILDHQALDHLYGPSKTLARTATHNLGRLPGKWVGTFTASPGSDTLSVRGYNLAAWFDLRSGVNHISTMAGYVHSWNSAEMEVAVATNTGNNVFIGGALNNTMADGIGASLFVGNAGNDTLYTGKGKDIIFEKAGDGDDLVMDYDPAEDIIEFDGGIAGYSIVKEGKQQHIVFHDGEGDRVASVTVSSPEGKLGVIRKSELSLPDHYQTMAPVFKPGEETVRQWNDDATQNYIEFPDGITPTSVEFSNVGNNSKFIFFDEFYQYMGSITFRGIHDFFQYSFKTKAGDNIEVKTSVRGTLTLPDGTATAGSDGIAIIDTRHTPQEQYITTRDNVSSILENQATIIFLSMNSLVYRAAGDGHKTFEIQPILNHTLLNRFDAEKDTFSIIASLTVHQAQLVHIQNDQYAIIFQEIDPPSITVINHLSGAPEKIKLLNEDKSEFPLLLTPLSALSPAQQQAIREAAETSREREATLTKDLRLGSLLDKNEFQNLTSSWLASLSQYTQTSTAAGFSFVESLNKMPNAQVGLGR